LGPLSQNKAPIGFSIQRYSTSFGLAFGRAYLPLTLQVEVQLQKADNRGWVLLEKTTRDLGGVSYTFGVGGRTGTVGGKELHLDAGNQAQST
jgi:hypothetical protein